MSLSQTKTYPVSSADQSSGDIKLMVCNTCDLMAKVNDVDWDAATTPTMNCVICPEEPELVEPNYNATDEQYEW